MNQQAWHFKCFGTFCFLLGLFMSGHVLGAVSNIEQAIQVKGVVTDQTGELLPGVNVFIKGTAIGAITDLEGAFALNAPSPKSILIVSFIGYQTHEVIVGNNTSFKIVLQEEINALDEVVVVAYGSQKKQTVTGAVTMMRSEELLETPVSNITNALAGKLPGVITKQPGGRPGADNAEIYIRGVSTFNDTSPLIIIDGIEQTSFSQLDPNEIESLSVLKDASSTAVYGIRGANGVLLITTKRGNEGRPKISLTANWGLQSPTQIPEFLGSYEHLLLRKKAWENDGKDPVLMESALFSPEALEGFRLGEDKYKYPNINWYKEAVKPVSLQQQYNLNVSGGTKVVKYFVSVGYLNQGGMFNFQDMHDDYDPSVYFKRFNFRSNIDLKINKYQTLSANISGRSEEMNGVKGATGEIDGKGGIFQGLIALEPWRYPLYNPNGTISNSPGNQSAIIRLGYNGYENKQVNYYDIIGTLRNDLSFLAKGLSFDASISFNNNYGTQKSYIDGIDSYYYDTTSGRYDQMSEDSPFRYEKQDYVVPMRRTNLQLKLAYGRRFGQHNVNSLLVYNQQKTTTGNGIPSALMGYAARIEYGYADKYLIEGSVGYNGSENFAKGHRFGLFPSGSVGYVISEEPFMKRVKSVVSFLKVRGSIGLVGNDKGQKTRFLYMGEYGSVGNNPNNNGGNPNFGFGTTNPSSVGGITEKRNENVDLTWETALKMNIGLEGRLFHGNLFSFTVDVFKEHRKNILMEGKSAPQLIGLKAPWVNRGEVENWGYEMEFTHRNKINQFEYYIKGNYSFSRNKILYRDDAAGKPYYQKEAGYRINQFRGYEVLGFFLNEEEIKNSPSQSGLGGPIIPGDLKYRDVNKDGAITDADIVPIGYSPTPEIMYAITPGFSWKGIEVSVMFQGAAHSSVFFSSNAGFEFGGASNGGQVSKIHQDYWTPENLDASYPSLHKEVKHNNKNLNSFHLKSANYLRLKNVQVGYSFPAAIYKKMRMTGLKMYLTASNLHTWSSIDNFDPESVNTNGDVYPQQSVYNLGVNINF